MTIHFQSQKIYLCKLIVSKDKVGAFYSITMQNFSCKVYIVETLHSKDKYDFRQYFVSCLTSQEDKRGVRWRLSPGGEEGKGVGQRRTIVVQCKYCNYVLFGLIYMDSPLGEPLAPRTLYAFTICIHYMHSLYAFTVWIHYMHSLYAFTIFIHYMHSLYEFTICIQYMHSICAFTICIHYLHSLFAFTICIHHMHSLYAFTIFIT